METSSITRSSTGIRSLLRRVEERVAEASIALAALLSGGIVALVIWFVMERSWPLVERDGLAFLLRPEWDTSIIEAWADPAFWAFGAYPLIVATLLVVAGAVLCSTIVGLGCAIFLSELAPKRLVGSFESVLRMLAGVPSVVFGLIGLTVVVPVISYLFITPELTVRYIEVPFTGQSLLAAVIVLTFMIMPFFVTVATDSMRAVPTGYRHGGAALGMTHWRVIRKIVLPSALPGLLAGVVLAAARGIGEAIAMSMVAGALSNIPSISNGFAMFLEPVRVLASAIVENGEGMSMPQIEAALFSLGAILLVMCVVLSIFSRLIFVWLSRRVGLLSGRQI